MPRNDTPDLVDSGLEFTLAGESCPIFVGDGLLDTRPHQVIRGKSAVIITNPQVGALYTSTLATGLESRGIGCQKVEIPDGETFKTLDTVSVIYDQLAAARVDRGTTVLALGGGVVGDVAGFAAATFLRGLDLVQVPTTLLAMVDSSIGGKVGVDHPLGKNLIGAWKLPRAVVSDTSTLTGLPDAEWRAGLAEVVKHGIIADEQLFAVLSRASLREDIAGWLPRAIRVKVDIVARDPFEWGERAKLNLGHTFGHALEQVSRYELRHGDAVAMGLMCAARLAVERRLARVETADRIEQALEHLKLPTRIPNGISPVQVLQAMQSDKKRRDGRLRFVLPRRIGHVETVDDVRDEETLAVMEGLLG